MAAPLFLLAPPRSYTSLINAMLGQHPQAFGLPELCLFNGRLLKDLWIRETDEMSDTSRAKQGILRAVAEIYAGEQTKATITMANHWAAARENVPVGEVYQELVRKLHPLIAVEKSPAYTIDIQRMFAMHAAFPNARFLHLTRHPVGQCKSVMQMNDGAFALYVNSLEFQEDRAIVEPQYQWHDLNINILNFLETVPDHQQLRIRGEDIMADPPGQLGAICRWLQIRDDAAAIDEMMHPERSPFACFGPLPALFGNDPNFLRGPTFRPHVPRVPKLDQPLPWRDDGLPLHPRVVALAQEFGYA